MATDVQSWVEQLAMPKGVGSNPIATNEKTSLGLFYYLVQYQ